MFKIVTIILLMKNNYLAINLPTGLLYLAVYILMLLYYVLMGLFVDFLEI